MKKVLVPTFKFMELSDEVKDKVRQEYSDFYRESGIVAQDVRELFTDRLSTLGYPTDKVYWSLNYCQGDGMAFYGPLYTETLVKLRDRLMPGRGRSLPVTFFEQYVTMSISDFNTHYNHYNSMHLDIDLYRDITAKRQKALDEFYGLILDDMKQTSKELEAEGYSLIESYDELDFLNEVLTDRDEDYFEDGRVFDYEHETCMECIA